MEIKRQNIGRNPTRFGIVLNLLKPRYRKILLENSIIKRWSVDDKMIRRIFSIEDKRIKVSHLNKVFIEPKRMIIDSFKKIRETYNWFDWECAFCKTAIKSRIDNYEPSNFTCKKCDNVYLKGTKKIPKRIIESSLDFTEHVKKLMKDDQQKLIKYIRKNDESKILQ